MTMRVAQPIETLHGGGIALACAVDGTLAADALHGMFADDTRVLSTYRIALGGTALDLLSRTRDGHGTASWQFQNQPFHTSNGDVPAGSIFVSLRRRVDGAMHDDLQLTSYLPQPVRTTLSIHVDADFADVFEVKRQRLPPRVAVHRIAARSGVLLEYRRKDFHRALRLSVSATDEPVGVGSHLVFDVELAHGRGWECCIEAIPEIENRSVGFCGDPHQHEDSVAPALNVSCDDLLAAPFRRGCADLHALTISDGTDQFVAAGMPWFNALFGRDVLVTSLMTGLLGATTARGALRALAGRQATEIDRWRDAEPGKLPHELRRGELAHFGVIPHTPYYGTHDAQALYCLALWNTWRWTGDRGLLEDHLDTARRAVEWCDHFGDRDADGLQEYGRHSPDGYYNQSWKDADDAIVGAHGELGKLPLATVELQGYLYAARLAMAELLDEVAEPAAAAQQRAEAELLARRVEQRFHLPDDDFYALALDGDKHPLPSISSNPGHLLWCGLTPPTRAAGVARRLLQPDLYSGWGLRTLSSDHPAYNPLSYQCGSVWPHDTAIAAAGLFRYGEHDAGATLLRGLLDASRAFEDDRLPELFAGFARSSEPPVPYAQANVPQAWAAASPVLAVQLLLGIVPDAPGRRCFLEPWLPDWLAALEVEGIRIGEATVDVRMRNGDEGTTVTTKVTGDLEVVLSPAPAPLWGTPAGGSSSQTTC